MKKSEVSQAINPADDIHTTDLRNQESQILNQVKSHFGENLKLGKIFWRSDYYGTGQLGAFHAMGELNGRAAVIKIQGAKPEISEVEMISKFSAQNRSNILKAPEVFDSIPWNDQNGYEVIVMQFIDGQKVIQSGKLLKKDQIKEFFRIHQEYREKCLNSTWLSKPSKEQVLVAFEKLKIVSSQVKPDSPLRLPSDADLIENALKKLELIWSQNELEFQHGHFSAEDLIKSGKNVYLTSNLFWKWKPPFYDRVFGYHWFMLSLAQAEGISPDKFDLQRAMWLEEIQKLPEDQNNSENHLLINAALLERAVAGLLIDSFSYIDEDNQIFAHIIQTNRSEVERLTKILT